MKTLGSDFGDPAAVQAVENGLREAPSIFHYTGHGTVLESARPGAAAGGPHAAYGEEALCLADGYLGTWSMREWDPCLEGALVILNSCMTGRVRGFGGMREDLASTFQRLGAEAVVASAFPVSDWLGAKFGVDLHTGGEEELQERFLQARRSAAEFARANRPHLWPGWALLSLHGNPFMRMPERQMSKETIDTAVREAAETAGVGERELRRLLE